MSQTLENVLTDMVMHGGPNCDRVALVRSEQEGKSAGVCVVMTSKKALRELCKPLLRVAKELGNAPADFGSPGMSEKLEFKALFEIADLSPHGWCWGEFKFFKLRVTVAIFCRSVEDVAGVCTKHGAPCSIDRKEAPAGYRVEKYLERTS